MSSKELKRLEAIRQLDERRLTRAQAGQLVGLGVRQMQRLLNAYRQHGPPALISRKRGQPSNRRYPRVFGEQVVDLIRTHYGDFGPTLASEKLGACHELYVSVPTLRRWMIDAGIWVPRRLRERRVYQPRYRRECFGELVQIDGSEHHWFEDRGPPCTLLVYIDDATGRLLELRFVTSESTFDYFLSTQRYLRRYGKPVAFYSDKHSIFRVNRTLQDRDLHRPLQEHEDLDEILCWQEERTVSNSLTLQYDRVLYVLEPDDLTRRLRRRKVRVYDFPDGTLDIRYRGRSLPFTVFDKVRQVRQADVVSNKRLSAALQFCQERQAAQRLTRSRKAPARRAQLQQLKERGINPALLSGSSSLGTRQE
jgi:hypothetical protein